MRGCELSSACSMMCVLWYQERLCPSVRNNERDVFLKSLSLTTEKSLFAPACSLSNTAAIPESSKVLYDMLRNNSTMRKLEFAE